MKEEGIRFKAGEQRNESGVNTFFASPSGVNAISQQSLGSAFTVTRTVDLTTRQDFPIAAAGGNATIFTSNGEMFAGSDRDTIGQQTSLFLFRFKFNRSVDWFDIRLNTVKKCSTNFR